MNETSVALFATHPLGEQCLEYVVEHEEITVELVVTYPPDADTWWNGNVYETAREHDLTVVPIREEKKVLDHDIDYLISIYYPNILSKELLDHPTKTSLNLHQAELPRFRGSNVFTHAILNARDDDYWKYGTTFHIMTKKVDSGPIIDRRFVSIEETDTARSLYEKIRPESAILFKNHLSHLVDRTITELATPQSEFEGPRYYYPKSSIDELDEISLEDLKTDSVEMYDRIRALDFPPHEPAHAIINNKKVYLTLDYRGYNE